MDMSSNVTSPKYEHFHASIFLRAIYQSALGHFFMTAFSSVEFRTYFDTCNLNIAGFLLVMSASEEGAAEISTVSEEMFAKQRRGGNFVSIFDAVESGLFSELRSQQTK